jgi:hypothetical protein
LETSGAAVAFAWSTRLRLSPEFVTRVLSTDPSEKTARILPFRDGFVMMKPTKVYDYEKGFNCGCLIFAGYKCELEMPHPAIHALLLR